MKLPSLLLDLPHYTFAALHFCAAAVALVAAWKAEVCHDADTPTMLWRGGEGVFTPHTQEQQARGFALAGVLALAPACWIRPGKGIIVVLLAAWIALHTAATEILRETCRTQTAPGRHPAGRGSAYLAAGGGGWAFATHPL